MAGANGNGVWKWVAAMLGAVLVTGATFWFTFGASIQSSESINGKLDSLEEAIKHNTTALRGLNDVINKQNLLLSAHGITLENLQPRSREGQ